MASELLERGYSVRVVARGEALPWLQGVGALPRVLSMLALLPTVTPEVPYAAALDGAADPIMVVRRGARPGSVGRSSATTDPHPRQKVIEA
jgi:hypothetical protein